jgi:EAL domain-containing protein (putative c-di-GMP-specific phosphodiesterase class I)
VLREVCRQLKDWASRGLRLVPVALNLSARQFLAPDLAETIRRTLEESGVSSDLVEVEITESSIMTDPEEAIRTLQYLDSIGVKIAIDDFGTGYSSLAYLKRFPLRALKIDQSFVRDITTDPDDATITQAVISMAHSLGLKVIAEGVETNEQLAFLTKYRCDEIQGYILSRAVPEASYGEILEKSLKPARLRGLRQRKGLRAGADNP